MVTCEEHTGSRDMVTPTPGLGTSPLPVDNRPHFRGDPSSEAHRDLELASVPCHKMLIDQSY